MARWAYTALSLFLPLATIPAGAATRPAQLSPAGRESLRFQLQNLLNEEDLLIRNKKSDESDLRRQEREFAMLKIYERIPFQEDLPGLKENLSDSAQDHGVKLTSFHLVARSSPGKAIPDDLYTDAPEFRLKPEQIVTTLRFRATVEGDVAAVQAWIRSWPEQQMRLTEPERAPRKLGENRWEIAARAFRFRDVKFPHLMARDPVELLPSWARRKPESFAQSEPKLWEFVERIRDLEPKAAPYYKTRERFLLNDARLSFFFAKATKPSDSR